MKTDILFIINGVKCCSLHKIYTKSKGNNYAKKVFWYRWNKREK